MSKTKEINHIIVALDQHISGLTALKSDLKSLFTSSEDSETATITLENVRAVLADKSRLGFTKDIKQIILDLGATKLSEVKESDYAILLKKVEVLGNE